MYQNKHIRVLSLYIYIYIYKVANVLEKFEILTLFSKKKREKKCDYI